MGTRLRDVPNAMIDPLQRCSPAASQIPGVSPAFPTPPPTVWTVGFCVLSFIAPGANRDMVRWRASFTLTCACTRARRRGRGGPGSALLTFWTSDSCVFLLSLFGEVMPSSFFELRADSLQCLNEPGPHTHLTNCPETNAQTIRGRGAQHPGGGWVPAGPEKNPRWSCLRAPLRTAHKPNVVTGHEAKAETSLMCNLGLVAPEGRTHSCLVAASLQFGPFASSAFYITNSDV